jgi:hypothetical protein
VARRPDRTVEERFILPVRLRAFQARQPEPARPGGHVVRRRVDEGQMIDWDEHLLNLRTRQVEQPGLALVE